MPDPLTGPSANRSTDRRFDPSAADPGPPPSERVRVRRNTKKRGRYERELVEEELDATPFCHLGYVHDGNPVVIPTLQVRRGDVVYLHASTGSRLGLSAGTPWRVCLTVTLIEGFVLARSGFHHSINYRSVVVMGDAVLVTDPQEKLRALDATVDHVAPGRSAEVRPPTARELEATAVARLPLTEASVKYRSGPPVDEPEDVALPIWAGVLPMRTLHGAPVPSPDLPAGVPLPPSVMALVDERGGGPE